MRLKSIISSMVTNLPARSSIRVNLPEHTLKDKCLYMLIIYLLLVLVEKLEKAWKKNISINPHLNLLSTLDFYLFLQENTIIEIKLFLR